MSVFNLHEAKTHFSKLLERVMNGEEVVIAKAGKPVARLLLYIVGEISPRVPGIDRGKVIIKPDFDAPLPEFDLGVSPLVFETKQNHERRNPG